MNTRYATENSELAKAQGIDSFIGSCSHTLKSPLTSIEGLVRIAEYFTSQAEVKRCLNVIQHCASNMLQMIHNIEENTNLQNRQLNKSPIQAGEVVARVVNWYRKDIDEHQIAVTADVLQSSPWISDEHCNYLILKNLLGNAINFRDLGKESKEIVIKLHVTTEKVFLEVSDNGIGIGEEEKEKIFEPFYRSSNQSKGIGLGLFLVKSAIYKLNASINVTSSVNAGASFRITMPNHQAA